MSKEATEKERCGWIFFNLYTYLNYREKVPASFIRELYETQRCDKLIKDFTSVRMDVERNLPFPVIEAIKDFKESPEDERRAGEYIINNTRPLKTKIWDAMLPSDHVSYYMFEAPHEILSTFSIFSGPYAGFRRALKMHAKKKNQNGSGNISL